MNENSQSSPESEINVTVPLTEKEKTIAWLNEIQATQEAKVFLTPLADEFNLEQLKGMVEGSFHDLLKGNIRERYQIKFLILSALLRISSKSMMNDVRESEKEVLTMIDEHRAESLRRIENGFDHIFEQKLEAHRKMSNAITESMDRFQDEKTAEAFTEKLASGLQMIVSARSSEYVGKALTETLAHLDTFKREFHDKIETNTRKVSTELEAISAKSEEVASNIQNAVNQGAIKGVEPLSAAVKSASAQIVKAQKQMTMNLEESKFMPYKRMAILSSISAGIFGAVFLVVMGISSSLSPDKSKVQAFEYAKSAYGICKQDGLKNTKACR